jgi:hypothetical protein
MYLYKKVINKSLFVQAALPQIIRLGLALAISTALINISIVPFGGIYIYTLVHYHTIHSQTLAYLNAEGAL